MALEQGDVAEDVGPRCPHDHSEGQSAGGIRDSNEVAEGLLLNLVGCLLQLLLRLTATMRHESKDIDLTPQAKFLTD